jgi:hypothetical protein
MLSRFPALSRVVLTVLAGLVLASPAIAGPPLLCHPYDIGAARSLPWGGGTPGWRDISPQYPLADLVKDTEALLIPSTPVIVRMETLRRAAVYASQDPQVAARLFTRLTDRILAANQGGKPDGLAYLDAAYYSGALSELSELRDLGNRRVMLGAIVRGTDAYALALKSIALRPGDPAVEFAAALIASDSRRAEYSRHAEKARAGATRDALLARNIEQVR